MPSLSPDGSRIAYSHQGDVWVASIEDGRARRLTAHPAYDTRPMWSPDGERIAFLSTRNGGYDVFMIDAGGGVAQRMTWHSSAEMLDGWLDNDHLLVGVTRDRWYSRYGRSRGVWTVGMSAGTPQLLGDFPANRTVPSPDGSMLCYQRGSGDMRRRAYRGSASDALWVYQVDSGEHRMLTEFDGSDLNPMWGGDGSSIFFLSDRPCSGNEDGRDLGLWRVPAGGGDPAPVFHPGARGTLRYASMSADGRRVVAEFSTGLLLIDTASGSARELAVYGGRDSGIPDSATVTVDSGASDLAISPDGESIAFEARGDVYVMRKHEKIDRAVRVSSHPAPDYNPVWTDDGKALLFVSERDGNGEVYRARTGDEDTPFYRARSFELERLTETEADESMLSLSPDGKHLVWVQGNGRFVLGEPDTLAVRRVLVESYDSPDFDWSPDSGWLAYTVSNDDFNVDIFLVRSVTEGLEEGTLGIEPYNLSRHPDDDTGPVWSADGRKIAFTSRRQVNDETDVWVAWLRSEDLDMNERERLEAEEAREKAKKAEKKAAKKAEKGAAKKDTPKKDPAPPEDPKSEPNAAAAAAAAGQGQEPEPEAEDDEDEDEAEDEEEKDEVEPVVIDFARLQERIERVTRREGNESVLGWHHESEKIYYNATVGTRLTNGSRAETGFFTTDVRERDPEKLGSSPVSSMVAHEEEVFYVKGGKITARGSKETSYEFSVRFREDRRALREAVMEQAWRVLDRWFYDTGFHGIDWSAALEHWRPVLLACSAPEDFNEFMNWLLGELNSSHMGFTGSGSSRANETDSTSTGELGVIWDHGYPGPGMRVLEVLDGGPAARAHSRLADGDVITAVDGMSVQAGGNFDRLMEGTVGEETQLTVQGGDGAAREVVIRPGSSGSLRQLLYDRRTRTLRQRVETGSGGMLGYVHIQGMSTGPLIDFERDLFAAGDGKDALVIDVRENGGGWTTDMLLSMLMVNDHALTIPRGGGLGYPQGRRIFGTWNKPVVVLCNENSYSNAEIFSWAIQTLGRGPLVGKQTFGAVISTGGQGLLDGSFVRMPFRGWYVNNSQRTNMEWNGCIPDYPVENLPGDFAAGRDRQLEKAIEVGLSLVE